MLNNSPSAPSLRNYDNFAELRQISVTCDGFCDELSTKVHKNP